MFETTKCLQKNLSQEVERQICSFGKVLFKYFFCSFLISLRLYNEDIKKSIGGKKRIISTDPEHLKYLFSYKTTMYVTAQSELFNRFLLFKIGIATFITFQNDSYKLERSWKTISTILITRILTWPSFKLCTSERAQKDKPGS